MILQNDKTRVGSGSMKSYGVLFDVSWLWEEYISNLIEEQFYHPNNRIRKYGQKLFLEEKVIYPDFIGKDSKKEPIIADAKYKPIENIDLDDYYQILAYMYRFESKKAFFLFPAKDSDDYKTLHLCKGLAFNGSSNYSIREEVLLIKLGLRIPKNVDSYCSFVDSIKEAENDFVNTLLSLEAQFVAK